MANSDAILLVKFVALGQPDIGIAYPLFGNRLRDCIANLCTNVEHTLVKQYNATQHLPEYSFGEKGATDDSLIAHKIYTEDDEMAAAIVEGFASKNKKDLPLTEDQLGHFKQVIRDGLSEIRLLPLSNEAIAVMRGIRQRRANHPIPLKKAANG